MSDWGFGKVGGVALNKSANVLLDINNISGGTYDPATGQILLYGTSNAAPTALPPMNLDDLAVAFKAVNQGTMPVVSIEDPIVSSPPEWPGRECFTVRYGPFYTDPDTGEKKVLDVSSKTHFGWVMYDADRQMKCLGLGKDNRTGAVVGSSVPGYHSWLDLAFMYWDGSGSSQTRFWFNPKEIVVQPSVDGKSMELKKAEMQLSTECMFSSNGQVESTPDAEYFANHFTQHYDEFAAEQVTYDNEGHPHYIFKELKQLAYLVGIVKWVQDNNIPLDMSFLQGYLPENFDSAPSTTPQTTVSQTRNYGGYRRTVTIQGGVNYCKDLDFGTGGNPTGLAAAALTNRISETNLAWNFNQNGTNYNVTALSVDKKEKDGGFSWSDSDASLQVNGAFALTLARHFDSFDITPTMFGWGWQAQPFALAFKGDRTKFNLCAQQWEGYGEIWYQDRAAQGVYKYVPSGMYDKTNDSLHIMTRFDTNQSILVYRYETKDTPGLLFSDNKTDMTMRLADGRLLDFDMAGLLKRTEDRNGNQVNYAYDGNGRLTSIGQGGGRTITLTYSGNRVTTAALPDGHSVTYTYDGGGNLAAAQVDAPTGRKVQYTNDADHRLLEVRDENGNAVESRGYDVYGRVQSTTQPGVATPISQNFSLANRRTQVSGPESFSQTLEFDQNYDPTRITDARTNTTGYSYNRYRDAITQTNADGRVVQYFYDYRGNRIATVSPNGRADLTLFDINNNPLNTFHANGGTNFTSKFDSEHVLVSGSLSSYSVDDTYFQYDAKGNLTAVIDANLHSKTFGYDPNGNRTLARDARGFATGFSYDANSRLIRTTNALGHRVDYTYDNRDNLTRTTTQAGTVDKVYNARNELVGVIKGDIGARRTNSYAYNAKHQIQSVTEPGGAVTVYGYDARGNLTNITHAGITRFAYEYDGLNRLTATRYSGTAGGGKAAIVPADPRGTESLKGAITITWKQHGDWGSNTNVTIQYSVDGVNWTSIATVAAANESYVWNTGTLVSDSVQLRFVRPGDASFISPVTASFKVLNGGNYYVNDNSTAGDNYCTVAGQPYNGTTVTGRTPTNPVNSVQAIIDNYPLQPGDVVFVDTGNYSINNDIVMGAADQGSLFKPMIITGPTNGGAAVITHLNPSNSSGCIFITNADWIAVEHLKLTRGRAGIHLVNAAFCTIRYNECFSNGVAGGPGQEGIGAGIWIYGEGQNLVETNACYGNGGNGGNGAGAGMNGGAGRGVGILVDSIQNTIRSNTCYNNGGMGGAAGSASDKPGYSEGAGIFVETSVPPISEGNQVTDNLCHDNDAFGRNELQARGGTARAYGIALVETRDSNIERNTVWYNWGWGGRSWNGSSGGKGGWGIGYGIYGQDETGLIVTKNRSYANSGRGDYGGDDLDDDVGTGWAAGIYLSGCTNSLIKNNLCYYNQANTYGTYGSEPAGGAFTSGIELEGSPGSLVANNTLIQNRSTVSTWPGGVNDVTILVSQFYLWGGSTNTSFQNNICDAIHQDSSAIWVQPESTAGVVSDYNDLYVHGSAFAGFWGTNYSAGAANWRSFSAQDVHSLTNNPMYYNAASNNFHLAYNSPLIDAGQNLSTVQEDGDGEARPAAGPNADAVKTQDIGYDEFVDTDGDNLADVIEKTVTMTNPNERDSDFDGLPDDWEVKYGLNPNNASGVNGANGDPDGDRYSNMQEYLGGSNPTNALSIPPFPPAITSFSPAGANVFIVEEDSVSFTATATDPNNDPITYAWRLDGVVKSTSNSWVFVTTSESSGQTTLAKEYQVELSVTAGSDQVKRQWAVVVNNRNHAPILNFITNVITSPDATVQLNPVYSDPDNQNGVPGDDNILSVEYSGWMTNASRLLAPNDYGSHAVTVTVKDDGNPPLSAAQTLTVSVVPLSIFSPTRTGTNFIFSFATISGMTYQVQFKNLLSDASWQTLQSVAGDGTVKTITNAINDSFATILSLERAIGGATANLIEESAC